MNVEDFEIMIKLHTKFCDSINPTFLMDHFYSLNIFTASECKELKNEGRPVGERASILLMELPGKLESIDLFQEILEKTGYNFLADEIKKIKSQSIHRERKCIKFGTSELILYRHKLKRLTHSGKHSEFLQELHKMEKQWLDVQCKKNKKISIEKMRNVADKYFYALDAYCEYKRLINDETFSKSDVFQKIRELSKFTSEINTPNMLCSARLGSALFVANKDDFETAHGYIKEAKQKFSMLKACRETGIVLYIEYNMFCVIYSEGMTYANKQHLLDLGHAAVQHFQKEKARCLDVVNDFQRMFSLKLVHLYLGIGLFGEFLDQQVTKADLNNAKYLLTLLENSKEQWRRLEVRWKWFYHTAKARVHYLENKLPDALFNIEKALSFAEEGQYVKEVKCTKLTLTHIRYLVLNSPGTCSFSVFVADVISYSSTI